MVSILGTILLLSLITYSILLILGAKTANDRFIAISKMVLHILAVVCRGLAKALGAICDEIVSLLDRILKKKQKH